MGNKFLFQKTNLIKQNVLIYFNIKKCFLVLVSSNWKKNRHWTEKIGYCRKNENAFLEKYIIFLSIKWDNFVCNERYDITSKTFGGRFVRVLNSLPTP